MKIEEDDVMKPEHFALNYRNLKPGEIITFGTYLQSVDGKELAIKVDFVQGGKTWSTSHQKKHH